MAQKIKSRLLAFLTLLLLVVPPLILLACGPFFPAPIFVERSQPDLPLDKYAAGNLGILQLGYSTSYLAVAYRYLSGRKLSASEQERALAVWDHYMHPEPEGDQDAGNGTSAFAPVGSNTYQNFHNCLDDAIETAEKTRAARAQQFGDSSTALVSWSDAQKAVFANCSSDGATPVLPLAADANLPPIIQKDRDYQIAAAYFYARNWNEARKRFLAISEDSSSPWRATAGLVAARCDIRAATLGADNGIDPQKSLTAAEAQLRKIIDDPVFSTVRASADRLRGYVEFRLDPNARILELSKVIEQGSEPDTLQENLDDYAQLSRRGLSPEKLATVREGSDMTDWIFSFRGADKEDRRISRWSQTKSIPWLVAALAWAGADTPQLGELLDAADKVSPNSPAYLTVKFHRDRLISAAGKHIEAGAEIDKVLAMTPDNIPPSARNALLALRMKDAANLDEFLKFAPRPVVRFDDNAGVRLTGPPVEFDDDAAEYLTSLVPTSVLAEAAKSSRLPSDLRLEVAKAAWTRAVLLNQVPTARSLTPVLTSLENDGKFDSWLKAYDQAGSGSARTFAAAFLLLHNPEMRPSIHAGTGRLAADGQIDNYRDNWWCPLPQLGNRRKPDGLIAFLSDKDRQAAETEATELAKSSFGSDWLADQVVTYARANPKDDRVPEALHLVVVATHLANCGNTDVDSEKAAFTLLHRRYPKSEWAARTPYWYN